MQKAIENLKEKLYEKDKILESISDDQKNNDQNIPFLTAEIQILEQKIIDKE